MNVVLDASAAAEIVLGRDADGRFSRPIAEADVVLAPDLYTCEVANLFWKYHALAGVERDRCATALRDAMELPDVLVPSSELHEEVFDAACRTRHPAYDIFSLILARRHAAILLTADRKLSALCRKLGVRQS
ncbi:MAG: type II toxin-antitoxin system VapC family toxin [Deltaproteobacteria bacterium]|nr:type II toxin-antitoxin system VapC family toxin [Deltaproteobacteria bacterium]